MRSESFIESHIEIFESMWSFGSIVPSMTEQTTKRQPSKEQLAAMGRGRKASSAVGAYLEALEQHRPKRGRRVSAEDLEKRIEAAKDVIATTSSALQRLNATQELMDLERRLEEARAPKVDLSALERGFVEFGAIYAESKVITYEAFKSIGVSPAVLKEAGIKR